MKNYSWICCHCGLPNFTNYFDTSSINVSNTFESLTTISTDSHQSLDTSLPPDAGPPLHSSTPTKGAKNEPTSKKPTKNTNTRLRCMLINCDSIKSRDRAAHFKALVCQHKPDVILGCESKLNDGVTTSQAFPEGYRTYRRDRAKNDGGGGVFICVKDDIVSDEAPELKTDCEVIWATLKFANTKTLHIGSYYRPPSSKKDALENLSQSLGRVFSKYKKRRPHVIIGGDFNLGDIDWTSEHPQPTNPNTKNDHEQLLDCLADFGLSQHVTEPTRPASGKTLDLVITSNPCTVTKSSTASGMSDHNLVIFDVNARPTRIKKPPHKVFIYKKADPEKIKADLLKFQKQYFNTCNKNSVEQNWNSIKTAITTIMENHIPTKMTSPKTSLPWINRPVKREMRKRDRLFLKAKHSRKDSDWAKYRSHRNALTKSIRKAHNTYLNDVIGGALDTDPKKFWGYLKYTRTENIGIATLKSGETLHISDKDKAEALNRQFQSVFTVDDDNIPNKGPPRYPSIPDLSIGEEGVRKQLSSINARKACGPDEIPAKFLYDYAEQLSPMLSHLYQQTFDTGEVPSDWITAQVTAIYKKGPTSAPENYRPISLTCIACKIMEHIVVSHLSKHLDRYNILANAQHGFRRRRSCETQLAISLNDWAETLNAKGQVDVLLLDFSKAFDVVSHQRLLHKLQFYGVGGKTNLWIKSFLAERSQTVVVNGTHSSPIAVTSGVPQGSVLGPVLFLLYINDIADSINSPMRLFADDSILYREINSPEDHILLQQDIDRVYQWASDWRMSFNVKKCFLLPVTLKRKKSTHLYTMDGKPVSPVSSHPYLGVKIAANLSWNPHCDQTTAKANKTLGVVQRALGPCNKQVKERAYQALVRPTLEYATGAWNPHTDRNVNKIEMVQRRAARFVCGDYRRTTSVTSLLHQLGWVSLEHRRLLAQATMFFKIQSGLVDITFPQSIIPSHSTTTRSQHTSKFQHLQCTNLIYRYSLFPRTIPIWNSLSSETIGAQNVKAFQVLASPVILGLQPTPPLRRL
jgi:exonuclease III